MVRMFKHNKTVSLLTIICILFLISVGINIYQQIEVNEYEKNIENLTQHYMSMHEGVFYNALYSADTSEIQNIKDVNTLNQVIEELQKAEVYYEDAKYTENYWNDKYSGMDSGMQTRNLINGYITQLKSFRAALMANKNITTDDMNSATTAINDLSIIAEWLYQRDKNNDLTLYGDRDFYDNVFGKLSSDVKTMLFQFSE